MCDAPVDAQLLAAADDLISEKADAVESCSPCVAPNAAKRASRSPSPFSNLACSTTWCKKLEGCRFVSSAG